MILLGVDCGYNGAICVFQKNTPVKSYKLKNLKESVKLAELINHYMSVDNSIIAFIERQSAWVGDKSEKRFGIQKLVANYTMIKTVLQICGCLVEDVSPRTWQSQLRLVIKNSGETDKERKNRYKEAAKYYFPEVNVTLGNADALLILEYARRCMKYMPNNFTRKTTIL